MRHGLACSFLALVSLAGGGARAEPLAPALVRVLDTPGRPHPLADATGRVPLTAALPPGADAASFGLFGVAPGVGAVRLVPADVAAFAASHPELRLFVGPPRHALLDVSGLWTNAGNFKTVTGLRGKGVAVGVVDTGLDVTHPDFRDENGKTRVAWMLVPTAPAGLHPDLEETFGCTDPKQTACAIYAAADIDAMLAAGTDTLHDLEGHGTHVTSIAAGNGGPLVNKYPKYVGVAPEATLIIAAPSKSEGFYDSEILNGARFVFDRADAMGLPVAVNLSLGGDYGSHDGTSPLEEGLSAFVGDDKPGHVIVVAAGNSGALVDADRGKGPYGQHTEVHVSPDEVARVPILAVTAAKAGQGFVWITLRPGDVVDVALDGPGGEQWVGFTGPGAQAGYASGSGSLALKGGVVNDLPSANPVLTKNTNSAVVVFTGYWARDAELSVRLRGSGDAELWVTGQGDAAEGLLFERAIRQGTINVPASAPALLAVGCTINRVAWTPLLGQEVVLGALGDDPSPVPDGACYFSASGPTPFGVPKPEISAPGGFVAAAMSVDADPRKHPGGLFDLGGCPSADPFCALVDQQHAIATGTSMSAPHVTGGVALLMGLDPTLTEARAIEVLQAGARRPTGHVPDPNQLGPGEMDLEGARTALLDPAAPPADPDLAKSWYTLSSAYARPDPTWPVWGIVELRLKSGALAGGADESKLALAVTGGGVYQALTKVRQGMWRFAVAGLAGDAGGSVTVDVTYAGASLGARTLPVGLDVWQANDHTLGAVGGTCACEAAGATRGGWGWGWGFLGLGALAAGLRRKGRRGARRE